METGVRRELHKEKYRYFFMVLYSFRKCNTGLGLWLLHCGALRFNASGLGFRVEGLGFGGFIAKSIQGFLVEYLGKLLPYGVFMDQVCSKCISFLGAFVTRNCPTKWA